jgi:transcriptional regulator with XRE-family HTH domain
MKKANENKLKLLGSRVKELRKERGLTQQALADLCEIDIRTIQRIESGKYEIGLFILYALADALEIKVGKLLDE